MLTREDRTELLEDAYRNGDKEEITRLRVIDALAGGNDDDYESLLAEAQIEGWTGDEDGPDRHEGEANWVGYIPSSGRAVWVTNSDPIWFDAASLQDAIEIVQSGDPDRMIN